MPKLSIEEKNILEELRNISGENIERINSIFLALMTYALMSYAEGQEIIIPYFGKLQITYKGDTMTPEGKEARVHIITTLSDMFLSNLGQYEDFKSGIIKTLDEIPIFNYYKKVNERTLRERLNDEHISPIED
jgi:hypothetical protein